MVAETRLGCPAEPRTAIQRRGIRPRLLQVWSWRRVPRYLFAPAWTRETGGAPPGPGDASSRGFGIRGHFARRNSRSLAEIGMDLT